MSEKRDATKCKICGRLHPVDKYREMKFYVCPDTLRVYLVAKEDDDGNVQMDKS